MDLLNQLTAIGYFP